MKNTMKNLLTGLLVITLANVGMLVIDQEVAMAANCNLTTTSNMFGSSTRGYSGNSSISLNSSSSIFGSSTSGYVGNPSTSINSTNTGFSNCFWNC